MGMFKLQFGLGVGYGTPHSVIYERKVHYSLHVFDITDLGVW